MVVKPAVPSVVYERAHGHSMRNGLSVKKSYVFRTYLECRCSEDTTRRFCQHTPAVPFIFSINQSLLGPGKYLDMFLCNTFRLALFSLTFNKRLRMKSNSNPGAGVTSLAHMVSRTRRATATGPEHS